MANEVVARYIDGRIVKGTCLDVDPTRPTCHIRTPERGMVEVKLAELKAQFFVKDMVGDSTHQEATTVAPDDTRTRSFAGIELQFEDGERVVGLTYGPFWSGPSPKTWTWKSVSLAESIPSNALAISSRAAGVSAASISAGLPAKFPAPQSMSVPHPPSRVARKSSIAHDARVAGISGSPTHGAAKAFPPFLYVRKAAVPIAPCRPLRQGVEIAEVGNVAVLPECRRFFCQDD